MSQARQDAKPLRRVLTTLSYQDVEEIWRQLKLIVLVPNKLYSNLTLDTIRVQRQGNGGLRASLDAEAAMELTLEQYKNLDDFKIKGTLDYMSPEVLMVQCQGKDGRTKYPWNGYMHNELWQLGLILFLMLYKAFPIKMYQERFVTQSGFFDVFSYVDATKLQNSPDCGPDKTAHQTLVHFYSFMSKNPVEYNQLFLPLEGKYELLYNDVKALLSIHPDGRIAWYNKLVLQARKQKSKRSGTVKPSVSMLLRAASELQQQSKRQEQPSKRARTSPMQVLLRAISERQQQSKRSSKK